MNFLKGRDFLKLLDFTPCEINKLIDLAMDLKAKKKNIFDLIAPIVTIVIGAMLIAGKFLDWLFIVVGVIFIINGVLELLGKKK